MLSSALKSYFPLNLSQHCHKSVFQTSESGLFTAFLQNSYQVFFLYRWGIYDFPSCSKVLQLRINTGFSLKTSMLSLLIHRYSCQKTKTQGKGTTPLPHANLFLCLFYCFTYHHMFTRERKTILSDFLFWNPFHHQSILIPFFFNLL